MTRLPAPEPGAPRAPLEWVAHRGCPRQIAENTTPSFLLAIENGADAIELDVHCSRDGEVVVHHDESVQGKDIANTPWAELAGLDLGGGARIPLLADVLTAVGDRVTVYIELKGKDVEQAALAEARRSGRRYAFHSFDHDQIARLAKLAPSEAYGLLLDRGNPDPADAVRRAVRRVPARDLWPHWTLVDDSLMRVVQAEGLRVIPWTVNDVATARSVANLGAAGLCTDDVRMRANPELDSRG